ncbi:unnamed protein product [Linum tenue]|uniref:Secreted peptide n=1 Tax=Linum tenue TaxID=586396 RepID=A0AAV0H2Y1_9ROSI|nr:unnamed protein product [Linum tenue]
MGFLVTTLIFVVVGIIASLCTRICCNRGPSTNLYASSLGSTSHLPVFAALLSLFLRNCVPDWGNVILSYFVR